MQSAWLPGAHFRRLAQRARPVSSQMLEVPFQAVKASMVMRFFYACVIHAHF